MPEYRRNVVQGSHKLQLTIKVSDLNCLCFSIVEYFHLDVDNLITSIIGH